MQSKDPTIKLFGKNITVPIFTGVYSDGYSGVSNEDAAANGCSSPAATSLDNSAEEEHESEKKSQDLEEDTQPPPSDDSNSETKKSQTQTTEEEEEEEETNHTNKSQEKTLKKPDEIAPCPRCKSVDTKFCYYNNYSVNQPRHYCRSCQRFWTSGGTMRTMAVGAGRRKNRTTSTFSEHDAVFVSNRVDETSLKSTQNQETRDDRSIGSSITTTDSMESSPTAAPPQIPLLHGVPWQVPPPQAFFPGFTLPVYPAPHWNYGYGPYGYGSLCLPSFARHENSPYSNSGKRSRDSTEEEEMLRRRASQGRLWVPKTLRINDPVEASRSSIWTTLGIDNQKFSSNKDFFKGFESKTDGRNNNEPSSVLQANPAALSRAFNFHERS